MRPALPAPEYYGGSAPSRPDQSTADPTRSAWLAANTNGQGRDGSRVHLLPINEGGAQLYPGGLWPYAADLQARQSTTTITDRDHERAAAPQPGSRAPHPGPDPPDWSRFLITRRHRWFLACTFSSHSPGPHHLAVLARPDFVRAAPTLPAASRIRLPSASPACCDRPTTKVSHLHSVDQAPHGARCGSGAGCRPARWRGPRRC